MISMFATEKKRQTNKGKIPSPLAKKASMRDNMRTTFAMLINNQGDTMNKVALFQQLKNHIITSTL
uniref:Uncharacterized protein n=1 Tax=Rhizophora mucronata TaxID=61149 RepID=A0A2P2IXS8_RHIMU